MYLRSGNIYPNLFTMDDLTTDSPVNNIPSPTYPLLPTTPPLNMTAFMSTSFLPFTTIKFLQQDPSLKRFSGE